MIRPVSPQQQITQLLCDWRNGDEQALEKLIPLIQPELHRLAHAYMSRERAGHTLQTTALLDDAYIQLAGQTGPPWQNRAHFFADSRAAHAPNHGALREEAAARKSAAAAPLWWRLDEAAVPSEKNAAPTWLRWMRRWKNWRRLINVERRW